MKVTIEELSRRVADAPSVNRRAGTNDFAVPYLDRLLFWGKVDRSEYCWTWTASVNTWGYGRVTAWVDGKAVGVLAHRAAYIMVFGPIPEKLELDHQCSNARCVNPWHLRPSTPLENIRRRMKPECKKGHPFTEENTYICKKSGVRHCRECTRQAGKRYRKRLAEDLATREELE